MKQAGGTLGPQADVFPPGLRVVPAGFEKNQRNGSSSKLVTGHCPTLRRQRGGLGGSAERRAFCYAHFLFFPVRGSSRLSSLS